MFDPAGLIRRLFRDPPGRDGQAEGLQEAALASGAEAAQELAQDMPPPARRLARMAEPDTVIREALSQKILLGWMQNRHQTLFPLTVNLRRLAPGQAGLLLQAVAVALAASGPVDPARMEHATAWLASVGASADQISGFAGALRDPPPLDRLMRDVQDADLGAYAYAMALAVMDQREAANQHFVEYLAARLGLPTNVVRSVNRRYRS